MRTVSCNVTHEGLIASSACLGGEIAQAILYKGLEKAEEILKEYLDIFGEDFYLELMDHGISEQAEVNKELLELAKKFGVKVIATNDVHFVNADDSDAHNILICLNTNRELQEDSDMSYTGQEFLKTPEEMAGIFSACPEAISNTREIVNKIEDFSILAKDIVIPHFPLPKEFTSENEYLRHLAYDGAYRLYPDLNDEIKERLDFELSVIKSMGFPGYFLIVQDFINAARKMGVTVGPGRGSAAGSVVAYCTGITNVDPIKYDLLFERFLNPERISMPDIDVDFDDEGRGKVLKYVVEKYGEERVAQIITFGSMDAIIKAHNLTLPDDFTKRWLLENGEDKITPEQLEVQYPSYADSFRWRLIEGKILKQNNIEVTDDDIRNHVKSWFTSPNAETPSPEQEETLNKIVDSMLTNAEEVKRINDQLYDERLKAYFRENITVNHQQVSYAEFIAKAYEHRH